MGHIRGEHTSCVSCHCLSAVIGSIPSPVSSFVSRRGSHLLPFVPDPFHPSPRAGSTPPPATAPPLPELCVTLCSLFKPATEETHSDNCSIGAVLHREPGWLDTRWMVIEKLRGRAGNESTKGYQTVRQIRERGEGKSEMKEGRWERWGDGRWQREISAEKQE